MSYDENLYKYQRYDLVNLLKSIYEKDDIFGKKQFKELMDVYMKYISSVVDHVLYERKFYKYDADYDERCDMEWYNHCRITAHDEAINKTLAFQAAMLRKHTMIFYEGCKNKSRLEDFRPGDRTDLGNFIFSTVSTCCTLTEEELAKIGVDEKRIDEELIPGLKAEKRLKEREYKTKITPNPDDILNGNNIR